MTLLLHSNKTNNNMHYSDQSNNIHWYRNERRRKQEFLKKLIILFSLAKPKTRVAS